LVISAALIGGNSDEARLHRRVFVFVDHAKLGKIRNRNPPATTSTDPSSHDQTPSRPAPEGRRRGTDEPSRLSGRDQPRTAHVDKL
jgi:hypothetical protein